MRALFISLVLALQLPAAFADSPGYRAGATQVGTPGSPEALIWYPTAEAEGTWQVGDAVLPASHDAAVAVALLDPLAAAFSSDGLRGVTVPVLLLRPQDSKLLGDGNAVGLAKAQPRPPTYQTLPGGHFVFTDKCALQQEAAAPEVCSDPPGVDRIAVRSTANAAGANFFRSALWLFGRTRIC